MIQNKNKSMVNTNNMNYNYYRIIDRKTIDINLEKKVTQ